MGVEDYVRADVGSRIDRGEPIRLHGLMYAGMPSKEAFSLGVFVRNIAYNLYFPVEQRTIRIGFHGAAEEYEIKEVTPESILVRYLGNI